MIQRKFVVTIIDDFTLSAEETIRELECNWGADEIESCEDAISREEALDILDDFEEDVEDGRCGAYSRARERMCDLPSVQPQTQTSEDCISRADAIDALHQSINLFEATERIEELPAVKPQNKSGEWIPIRDGYGSMKCNKCFKTYDSEAQYFNFCPKCGADLRRNKRNIL